MAYALCVSAVDRCLRQWAATVPGPHEDAEAAGGRGRGLTGGGGADPCLHLRMCAGECPHVHALAHGCVIHRTAHSRGQRMPSVLTPCAGGRATPGSSSEVGDSLEGLGFSLLLGWLGYVDAPTYLSQQAMEPAEESG